MQQSALCIDDQTLTQIFKGAPREFLHFASLTQQAPFGMGVLDPPKNEYPLFEHLVLWLYARWIRANISKTSIFGPKLSTTQKTNLGEAIDYLLYSNFLPLNAEISHRVSLLSLCYHEKFGFRDDPVLLQRMWYIRAYVLLEDSPNGSGPGERWKWFDHRLALVIYSWVRHNRKYHGCPKVQCHCRQLIDLYGVSIGAFKSLYMALEKACVSQLQFVRSNEPVWSPSGSTSLSRADDVKLYFKPLKKTWPHCFSSHVSDPDPPSPSQDPPSATTPTTTLSATASRPPPQVKPQSQASAEVGNSSLPPPHPSLPARPSRYVFPAGTDPRTGVKSLLATPASISKWPAAPGLVDPPPPYQPMAPSVQPPPPRESPPPPPPPRAQSASTGSSHQTQTLGHSLSTNMDVNLRLGPASRGVRGSAISLAAPSLSTSAGAPAAPASSSQPIPTSSPQSSTVSKEFVTAPSTPSIPTTTPTVGPVSPAKRGICLVPWPAGGLGQAIPSAPRSMREVKGTSSGPIPTGPRALTGVAKTAGATASLGRSTVYAGVPSAPRSMRGSLTVANGGEVGGSQRKEKENNSMDSKGDDAMSVDTEPSPVLPSQTPTVSSVVNNRMDAVRSETSGPNNEPIQHSIKHSSPPILAINKPAPFAPRAVPPTTGKRSRSDTKADEILAKAEMDAKAKATGPSAPKEVEPLTPDASQAADYVAPSLPPAKRVKTLAEPESPTRTVNKTFMVRKSVAKDGVAILAAVSKHKGSGAVKPTAQEKDKQSEHPLTEAQSQEAAITSISTVAATQKTSPTGNHVSAAPSEKPMQVSISPTPKPPAISVVSKSLVSVAEASRPVASSEPPTAQQLPNISALGSKIGPSRPIQNVAQGKDVKTQPTASRPSNTQSTPAPSVSAARSSSQKAVEMATDKANREETPVGNPAREKTARNAKAQALLIASAEPPIKIASLATRKTARAGSAKKANGRVSTPLNEEAISADRGSAEQLDQTGPGSNAENATEVGNTAESSLLAALKKGRANPPGAEARPKRKAAQKGKSESAASKARVIASQSTSKVSKNGGVAKSEIIDISSDESVANTGTKKDAMEVDEHKDSPTPMVGKKKVIKVPKSNPRIATLPRSPKAPAMEIPEVAAALQNGPPFATVLVQAADPEKRMQTAQHEARRLMCALIAVGVPVDWWMVGVTDNGFILRDEAAPLIIPLLTEATILQLSAIGIIIQITPPEPSSESDEEHTPSHFEFNLKTLPSQLANDEALPLVIFDGLSERRLRSQAAEEKRLRNMVDGLLGQPLLDAAVEVNAVDNAGSDEVLCLVCPKRGVPSQLNADQISRLGKVGLAVYRGETQLAGPLPIGSHSHSRSNSDTGTFDWRAMRTEVMKMKMPWEMASDHLTPVSSITYSPSARSTHSHSSSFTEPESSPADAHFRQLLRPNLWSGSGTFSRMASAGMRWGEFTGIDPDSTDESEDEDEPEQPRLSAAIHA